jgi:hypothetical protein
MEMGYAPGWLLGSTMLWNNSRSPFLPRSSSSTANASIADCTPLIDGATKPPTSFEMSATET